MEKADGKMPDSFYDWLDECPVQWFRERVDENSIDYTFVVPNDEEE